MNISDGMNIFLIDQRYFIDSKSFSSIIIDNLYDNRFSFVCEFEKKIVGFIIAEETKNHVMIDTLCVINEFKNQGIAKKLIHKCIDEITSKCINKPIQLMVSKENSKAIRIYQSFGFQEKESEQSAYFDGTDGLILEYNCLSES